MKKFYELDSITPKLIPDNNFNKENGLYFCGKKIEKYNKTCKANEMMCKDCMKKNKEMYNLNGHRSILININGRTCSNSFKNRYLLIMEPHATAGEISSALVINVISF